MRENANWSQGKNYPWLFFAAAAAAVFVGDSAYREDASPTIFDRENPSNFWLDSDRKWVIALNRFWVISGQENRP